eukprot:Skav232878  [mRNA]  locus=scaffold1432:67828:93143:- [translate_table: standard]
MVLLGEVGGLEEYLVAEAIRDGRITKPLVAWCCGTAAEAFDYEARADAANATAMVQFGHAGARARGEEETAGAKNRALAEAGASAHVPRSFDEFGDLISAVYQVLVKAAGMEGRHIVVAPEVPVPKLPSDFDALKKKGLVRKKLGRDWRVGSSGFARPANIVCSISDDRGAEATYAGVPISEVAKDEQLGVGGAISLLWFRRRLPPYFCKFLELCRMVTTADHGPCVSGAHNTIVAARAGKDRDWSPSGAPSGPRFGGALDDAARMFCDAFDLKLSPEKFVESLGAERLNDGFMNGIKSLDNPDARVVLIKEYATGHEGLQFTAEVKKHLSSTPLLDFALAVEQVTTKKKAHRGPCLILNVDGCIAVCFVDLLRGCGEFSRSEADDFVRHGVLNGLFVSSRTLGLVGHFLDQRRGGPRVERWAAGGSRLG